MIWLIGDPDDLTGAYVLWLAQRRGLPTAILAEHELGLTWTFGVEPPGVLRVEGTDIGELGEVTGAIVRLNPNPPPARSDEEHPSPDFDEQLEDLLVLPERRAAIQFMLDAATFTVANRPSCGRSNGSKPFQMRHLQRAGFNVARWITSNDADAAERFAEGCEFGCVVKASSGLRSHVRRWGRDHAQRFVDGTAPHVVQAYVPGHDVRVHVIGDHVFGTRVTADAVDYRFDGSDVNYLETDVPTQLAQRCVQHAGEEGLVIAGFDFRVDFEGSWYCLEVNPVPTFLPYEAGTGQRIGDALVDALAAGSQSVDTMSPLAAHFSGNVVGAVDAESSHGEAHRGARVGRP